MKHETKDNNLSASPAVEDLRTKGIWWIDRASNDSELIITSGAGSIAIASLYCQPMDEETKANAAYIVNAVNGFENLKAENTKLAASNLELKRVMKNLLGDVLDLLNKNDGIKLGTMGTIHIVDCQKALKND